MPHLDPIRDPRREAAHRACFHRRLDRVRFALLLLVLSPGVVADALHAELDRTRIAPNEPLVLRLIGDGGLTGEPDLSALAADFEVLSRTHGERMSVVDGAVSHTREWRIELVPRRAGRLEIPSLPWGGEHSPALAVEVVEAVARGDGAESRPILLRTEADTPNPYVQQAFHYRVKVLYREAPRRAALADPEVEGATIERDGEDRTGVETVDGRRYQVIERRFLVVPQRSGPLRIRGPRLDAVLPEPRASGPGLAGDRDGFFDGAPFAGLQGMAPRGRRLVESAPDLTLEVRPRPPDAAVPWLPAESVEIADEWIPGAPRWQVGEPVTRVLTLTARGTTSALLPPLEPATPDAVRMYPGQSRTEDLPGVGAPVAVRSQELALVPTRAGSVILPELRIPWWDTREDRQRVAVVPARTLEVAPAAGETPSAGTESGRASTPGPEPAAGVPVQGEAAPELPVPRGLSDGWSGWFWPGVATLLGLGWLLTLLRLRRTARFGHRSTSDGMPGREAVSTAALEAARQRVEQACLTGDARSARAALLSWARLRWGPPGLPGLGALAERLGDAASAVALAELDRRLYSVAAVGAESGAGRAVGATIASPTDPMETGTWNGAAAWGVLGPRLSIAEASAEERRGTGLPDLYPRRV